MFLSVLGIILIVLGFVNSRTESSFKPYSGIMRIVGFLLVLVGAGLSAVKQIEPGYVGVQKLFGKVSDRTLESGLNVINPLVEVVTFDIRTQNYTMSAIKDEGEKGGDDAIRVLSADGLEVVIDLTVLYKVVSSEAPKILKEIGTDYRNIIVRPICRTMIRDNAVYYDAVALYSTKRDEFQGRIFKTIESDFKIRGLVLEQLLVRNITLPASVKVSIESKINAEQDAQNAKLIIMDSKKSAPFIIDAK